MVGFGREASSQLVDSRLLAASSPGREPSSSSRATVCAVRGPTLMTSCHLNNHLNAVPYTVTLGNRASIYELGVAGGGYMVQSIAASQCARGRAALSTREVRFGPRVLKCSPAYLSPALPPPLSCPPHLSRTPANAAPSPSCGCNFSLPFPFAKKRVKILLLTKTWTITGLGAHIIHSSEATLPCK